MDRSNLHKSLSALFGGIAALAVVLEIGDALAQSRRQAVDHQSQRDRAASFDREKMFFPFIDTHTHIDVAALQNPQNMMPVAEAIVDQMADYKVEKTFLMPTPQGVANRQIFDLPRLLPAHQRFPDKIMLLGGSGLLGAQYFQKPADAVTAQDMAQFRTGAERIASSPAVVGFGEFGITHLHIPAMGANHPYESVAADHPLLLSLTDIAATHGLPIDVHFDLSPTDMPLPRALQDASAQYPNPPVLPANLAPFERFLAHNPGAKIVWAHVGGEPLETRTVDLCRQLLRGHPNLYMSFRVEKGGRDPALALDDDGTLKPAWRDLIVEFSDRFVLGSDTFYTDGNRRRGGSGGGLANFHRLLDQLPPDVARRVATENVYRIYRMPQG